MRDHAPKALDLETGHGKITFGDQRLLLLSASSLGHLRQELYEILGPIMAHELLFRFGFHDGSLAARTVRARNPELGAEEVLKTGPLVHTMEGMARVIVDRLEIGDDRIHMEGRWADSFEAQESLERLGRVDWSTCWILSGFASGYASEAMGRDLLCVERACRGKGDPECGFEILPAEQFPGLARKVKALREGLRLKERMKPTIARLRDKAFTSATHLAQILKDSADAILTVDENEIIQTWNRGAEELLGYTEAEAVGRHFEFLVPDDLRERGEIDKIRRETAEKGSLRNYETRRVRKDGEEVELSLTRTSIYDADGRYAGSSAILRDTTERKRLVEQLIQAESLAEVGELAAQVAHEIKQPLAGISGAIQVVKDQTPPDDPRGEVFTEILAHIRRLDETVLSLLRFTKPYRPVKSRAEVGLILDSALTMLEPSEEFAGVAVEREIDPGLGPIVADAQQLVQVVLNLLLNAAQALGGEDRTIRFRAHRDGDEVVVSVEDHGAGMTAEVRRQVFKPFFTSRHKGNGLGLPIARKILQSHGGVIHVDSEVGRGTVVTFRLPIE